MNSLEYQEELDEMIGDPRGTWNPDTADDDSKGTLLKKAIKYGLKHTHLRVNQNSVYKDQNSISATLTPVAGEIALPADFFIEYELVIDQTVLFDYKIDRVQNKIIFNDDTFIDEFILKYIPIEKDIVNNATEFNLSDYFKDVVLFYALRKYHLLQFDNGNSSQALIMAEDEVEDLLNKMY